MLKEVKYLRLKLFIYIFLFYIFTFYHSIFDKQIIFIYTDAVNEPRRRAADIRRRGADQRRRVIPTARRRHAVLTRIWNSV